MSENKTPAVDVKDFVLNRLRHESDKWYEARKQVFLEHVDELGIEQAETLSMVWSNMRFLKCRYAAEIEAKVKDWGGIEELVGLDQSAAKRVADVLSTAATAEETAKYSKPSRR